MHPPPSFGEIRGVVDRIMAEFSVDILYHERFETLPRHHAVLCSFFELPEEKVSHETKRRIQERFAALGWVFSRQVPHIEIINERREYFYLASLNRAPLDVGYHVTRRSFLPCIWAKGLLAGTLERANSDRHDSEGNIYVCATLGSAADAGVQGSFSGHWWRDHFAQTVEPRDPDWVILRVNLAGLGARIFEDIWSESGIVVSGIDAIPPGRLSLVYAEQ
jgi:hypothetical protein